MMTRAHKVCMLGDFGVGKTSLVARFMRNTFSDRYLTTVGVKVDSKEVDCGEQGAVKLVVWDIAGGSALDALNMSYLRGAGGLLLVADGTRASTMRTAIDLHVLACCPRRTVGEQVLTRGRDLQSRP